MAKHCYVSTRLHFVNELKLMDKPLDKLVKCRQIESYSLSFIKELAPKLTGFLKSITHKMVTVREDEKKEKRGVTLKASSC